MIPKKLHIIWVGDDSLCPVRHVQSWIDKHPDWEFKLWGNKELQEEPWINKKHMEAMAQKEWNGVADLMRWEILYKHGGVLVDADSFCLQPIPDWMMEEEAFCCWESEIARPGLLAAGYFGSVPNTILLRFLIDELTLAPSVVDRPAWISVGPFHLTQTWRKVGYQNLAVYPSHFFIPKHYTGLEYTGGGPVFAHQEWGSTFKNYADLK